MSNTTLVISRDDLPPPYAYVLKLDWGPDQNHIKVELSYPGVDQLSEEEWIEAGLNPTKNWKWSGQLPEVWQHELSEWEKWPLSDQAGNGYLTMEVSGGINSQTGYLPFDPLKEENIQSFIQAIRELAGLEESMQLFIRHEGKMHMLEAVFAEKKLWLHLPDRSLKELHWHQLAGIMKLIAHPEEELSKAKNKTEPAFSWDGVEFYRLPAQVLQLVNY